MGIERRDRGRRLTAALVAVGVVPIAGAAAYYFFPGLWSTLKGAVVDDAGIDVAVTTPVVFKPNSNPLPPAFVIPGRYRKLPRPPSIRRPPEATYQWAYGLGGVDAGSTYVRIEVRADTNVPVLVEGLRVKVVRRLPPLRGMYVPPAGGDLVDIRAMVVDLDHEPPSIELKSGY